MNYSGLLKRFKKQFLTVLLIAGGVVLSHGNASAQSVMLGCDPAVWEAMNKKALAQVAYDVAVTRELIQKPDSVLVLTCFDQAAGLTANRGGSIYSGNFVVGLRDVVPTATAGTDFDCLAIDELWTEISEAGINTKVPYATFNNLLTGSPPGPPLMGPEYQRGWDAAVTDGVFSRFNTAYSAIAPGAAPIPFSNITSSCEALTQAGVYAGPCPIPVP